MYQVKINKFYQTQTFDWNHYDWNALCLACIKCVDFVYSCKVLTLIFHARSHVLDI